MKNHIDKRIRAKSRLIDELINHAICDGMIASTTFMAGDRYHRQKFLESEENLPGRYIMSLSPEQRKILQGVTTEDFNHRPDVTKILWK